MKEMTSHLPPKTLRRADPAGNPHLAWIQAIRKNDPEWANSHFDYSAGLTEMVVLGNLALRAPGQELLWDAEKMEVTNRPELNRFVKPSFRENWGVDELRAAKRKGTEDLSTPAQLRDGTPLNMKKKKEEQAKAQAQNGEKGQGKKGKGKGKKQEPAA